MRLWAILLASMALPSMATAACERSIRTLQRAAGGAVPGAYASVARCSPDHGAAQFPVALKRTTSAQGMAAVATEAIRHGVIGPVHGMLEGIGDYSAREDVARRIGASCTADPAVLAFVRGLHEALKDRAFVSWSEAVAACPAPELTEDLRGQAQTPPALKFDNKYAKVAELYGQRTGSDGLPLLQQAAITAGGNNGPFSAILDAMVKSVTPEGLGAKPEPQDAQALSVALLAVAAGVTDEQIGRVSDMLLSQGATDAAATLLPRLHPGKQQGNGSFLYGLAAVETCEDAAVVHWAVVEDLGGRWNVLADAQSTAAGFKRKLKACQEPYAMSVTPQPIDGGSGAEGFAQAAADGAGVGSVKLKSEKRIELGPR